MSEQTLAEAIVVAARRRREATTELVALCLEALDTGVSFRAVADLVGVAPQTIMRWKKGEEPGRGLKRGGLDVPLNRNGGGV